MGPYFPLRLRASLLWSLQLYWGGCLRKLEIWKLVPCSPINPEGEIRSRPSLAGTVIKLQQVSGDCLLSVTFGDQEPANKRFLAKAAKN